MIIYEVNLEINLEIYDEFRVWLNEHISQMLQFPGFIQAILLKEAPPTIKTQKKLTVQYQITEEKALETYFNEHASKMRAEGLNHFGNKFLAKRRVFKVEDIFIR